MNNANNQETKQILIRNVRIFNGVDEELLESNILIENNLIKEISTEWVARSKVFTPLENLRQATSLGAELLSYSGERNRYKEGALGVIQEGAYADLVMVEGNPLEDITILADPDSNLKLIMNWTLDKQQNDSR